MVGRVQSEFLGPMIERIFALMLRRGELPQAPQELEGVDLQIDYVSPIARAQKSTLVFNFSRFLEQMTPLAQMKPEIFDNIDADATFRWAHKTLDAPMETLVDAKKVQENRQAQQQAMAEQQQMAAAQQQAGTMKDMSVAAKNIGQEDQVSDAINAQQAQSSG